MLRTVQTSVLLATALAIGLVKVGLYPSWVDEALVEARSSRVHQLLAETAEMRRKLTSQHPPNFGTLNEELRHLEVDAQERFGWWKATGDQKWVEELGVRSRVLAAKIEADVKAAGR